MIFFHQPFLRAASQYRLQTPHNTLASPLRVLSWAHSIPAILNKPNQLKPYCPDCGSDQQPFSSADNPGHFGSFKHLDEQLIQISQNWSRCILRLIVPQFANRHQRLFSRILSSFSAESMQPHRSWGRISPAQRPCRASTAKTHQNAAHCPRQPPHNLH